MWYLALSLALQIYFGIHAVKTGRPFVWVLVIILFSVFGVLGYILIELLPEWWSSRGGNQVKKTIGKTLDPEKDLKDAQKAQEDVDSLQNRMKLAEEYLKRNRFQEARDLYERSLSGIYAEDPHIMLGLAKAELGLNRFENTIATLDRLKTANPDFKSADGHLLYARALENSGRIPEAIHEYEALNSYYTTPEPACRLAQLYKGQGRKEMAIELFQSVLKRSASASSHFNELNKDWIKLAKREVGGS